MADKRFDDDPLMLELRKKHPKQGPDPKPGEKIEIWAQRYMDYVRKKHNFIDEKG